MATQTLTVDLGERSYPIYIGAGLLGQSAYLTEACVGNQVLLVTNETVGPLYADRVQAALAGKDVQTLTLADGELYKTLSTYQQILDALVEMRANRDVTVVALGGGVVGDMAGFAAATYQRGVQYVQIPTTMLAQVDSSVGGKTAVNHAQGKNLIGAFHQPSAVIIDIETLATLPARELSAGLAEVVKYGLLGDAEFFEWLEANINALHSLDAEALVYAINHACRMKADVVKADEREQGQRALLNLGHTFGHAIEAAMGYGEWLHGEAVAAGMVMAAVASDLPPTAIARIKRVLSAAGLPVGPPIVGSDKLLGYMRLDKKVLSGQIRLILLTRIGQAFVTADYDANALSRALKLADGQAT